ncbi:hypothetical protein QJ036_00340 [Ruminococcus sp. YH-rum2234]|uniref:Uncharacterized protein n=1 Tax=Fusibacillus kribbianus TaxID=3044208 RepID=A0AAP4EYS0_9FIRM|nr:hypothetical protein [Ruminococcus sp. YH-rum2234]
MEINKILSPFFCETMKERIRTDTGDGTYQKNEKKFQAILPKENDKKIKFLNLGKFR